MVDDVDVYADQFGWTPFQEQPDGNTLPVAAHPGMNRM